MPTKKPVLPEEPDDAPSDDFARALEAFEQGTPAARAIGVEPLALGTKVKGRVVSVGEEYLAIDFGGRSEGVAKTSPFRAEDGTLGVAVGDVLDLFVIETSDSIVLGAGARTDARDATRPLREAQAAGLPVSGSVTGVNAGGLEVRIGRARGFCPVSQIEAGYCEDPSIYIGRTLEFLVTSLEEGRGNVVLSRKRLLQREAHERAEELLARIRPGDELEGTVARLEPFGAFVDLGGVDGLVHVSEIRHERVAHPRDVLTPGEKVRVRVLRLDTDVKGKRRIALSIKSGSPDPWDGIARQFVPGTRVTGTVARLTDFGAFVTLAPGVDGLIHVSQAAERRIEHVREVLQVGQVVEVGVLDIDHDRKRISLTLRETIEASSATLEIPAAVAAPATDQPPEITTMAIALRKAAERAKRGG
jgi:small subunit ribosomal protein S1